jgi:hypothetical protein
MTITTQKTSISVRNENELNIKHPKIIRAYKIPGINLVVKSFIINPLIK